MTDWHIHIGKYNNVHYDYSKVFTALKNNKIDECWCAYITPKYDYIKNSLEFADLVVLELRKAKQFAETIGLKVNFVLWPDPIVFCRVGYSLQELFSRFDYCGIAIHPFHIWKDEDLEAVFCFSKNKNLPIFVHTGCSDWDSPFLFEKYFSLYPTVEVHLAHCKDPKPIIKLFSKYEKLYGDVAFCPLDSYKEILKAGYNNRLLFGTDFPITHWYHYFLGDKMISVENLTNSYKRTLEEMSWFNQ